LAARNSERRITHLDLNVPADSQLPGLECLHLSGLSSSRGRKSRHLTALPLRRERSRHATRQRQHAKKHRALEQSRHDHSGPSIFVLASSANASASGTGSKPILAVACTTTTPGSTIGTKDL